MKVFISACLVTLFLAGCATSKAIQGPNGSKAFFIKCGSAVIDACYEEAAKVCPKGYSMVDQQGGANAMVVPTGNSLSIVRGPHSMFIECKE